MLQRPATIVIVSNPERTFPWRHHRRIDAQAPPTLGRRL